MFVVECCLSCTISLPDMPIVSRKRTRRPCDFAISESPSSWCSKPYPMGYEASALPECHGD
ncbi:hypothetical protein DPMN_081591 [Dreissena polymorpha]|uniref:Uncharacterized protein n=1 Tax=Dreissena polymorpha TaxID=45954 RepID=A0A9D3Y6L3_DREPO|nr:hypothetical protein DPMN_081591 [Dreissena polymorpha]